MTLEEFGEISQSALDTFSERVSAWHQEKPAAWQYLIQLNTDLPYDDKYSLPIEMLGMEDSQEKTRSIILWRILQHQTDVESLKKIAQTIDNNIADL